MWNTTNINAFGLSEVHKSLMLLTAEGVYQYKRHTSTQMYCFPKNWGFHIFEHGSHPGYSLE